MAVEPIGPGLLDREAIGKGLTGCDAVEADPRNAVLTEGHDKSMPVDRGAFAEVVGHVYRNLLTFLEAQDRRNLAAVVAHAHLLKIARVDAHRVDCDIVGSLRGHLRGAMRAQRFGHRKSRSRSQAELTPRQPLRQLFRGTERRIPEGQLLSIEELHSFSLY